MPHTPPAPAVSRRQVAKGVAWSVPALAVASAAPALAGSPVAGALTGVTGYYAANPVGTCSSNGSISSVQPSASSTNPAPYVYASTGVSMGAQTGQSVQMTISLYNPYDAKGGSLGQRVTFVPGTYTFGAVTATSTCAATNASGACTSITITWNLSGVGTTPDNPQNPPFRVGLVSGTVIPSGDQVSTGFEAQVLGGGPAPVQSSDIVTFWAGTYSGAYTCAP